jgi:hypothetical protein
MAIKVRASVFQKLFFETCDIYSSPATTDETGHPAGQATVMVVANQPCKIIPLTTREREWRADKMASYSRATLYMMPIANFTLTEHHFVKVNGEMYNILNAPKPIAPGAPLEVSLDRVKS